MERGPDDVGLPDGADGILVGHGGLDLVPAQLIGPAHVDGGLMLVDHELLGLAVGPAPHGRAALQGGPAIGEGHALVAAQAVLRHEGGVGGAELDGEALGLAAVSEEAARQHVEQAGHGRVG